MHKKKNNEALCYVIFFIPVFHLGTDQSTTGSTLGTNIISVPPHATRLSYRRHCLAITTPLHVTVPRRHPHVRISGVLTIITDGQWAILLLYIGVRTLYQFVPFNFTLLVPIMQLYRWQRFLKRRKTFTRGPYYGAE